MKTYCTMSNRELVDEYTKFLVRQKEIILDMVLDGPHVLSQRICFVARLNDVEVSSHTLQRTVCPHERAYQVILPLPRHAMSKALNEAMAESILKVDWSTDY